MKRIAHIADIHLDEKFSDDNGVNTRKNWKLILEDVATRKIDEIIFGGDIGEKKSNQWFFHSLNQYSSNLKIILGNHDTFSEVVRYYNNNLSKGKTELYYLFEDEYIKYLFLDSSAYEISSPQFEWLTQQIQTGKKLILFIHHPVLEVDAAVDKIYPLKNRGKIKEALLKCNNDVTIFCAHYHMSDKKIYDNIKQFITPAASYQFRKESDGIEIDNTNFGYRIITIDKHEVNSKIILYDQGDFVTVN